MNSEVIPSRHSVSIDLMFAAVAAESPGTISLSRMTSPTMPSTITIRYSAPPVRAYDCGEDPTDQSFISSPEQAQCCSALSYGTNRSEVPSLEAVQRGGRGS